MPTTIPTAVPQTHPTFSALQSEGSPTAPRTPSFIDLSKITNVSFGVGGSAGVVYTKIIEALERHNIRPQLTRAIGASAGAIVAMLISLGATSQKISDINNKTNFQDLLDDESALKSFFDLLIHYGANDGNELLGKLQEIIASLGFNPNITLSQLHKVREQEITRTGKTNLCDLYITVCNLERYPAVQVAHHEHPLYQNVPIAKLVQSSCSIPLMFEPVKINEETHVDAGVVVPDPQYYFDNDKFLSPSSNPVIRGANYNLNPETLAFKLCDPSNMMAKLDPEIGRKLPKIDGKNSFITHILQASSQAQDFSEQETAFRTVYCDNGGISTSNFVLNAQQKSTLQNNGQWAFDLFVLENERRRLNQVEPLDWKAYIIAFLKRSTTPIPGFDVQNLKKGSSVLNLGVDTPTIKIGKSTLSPRPLPSSPETQPSMSTSQKALGGVAVLTTLIALPWLALQAGLALISAAIIGLVTAIVVAAIAWSIAKTFNRHSITPKASSTPDSISRDVSADKSAILLRKSSSHKSTPSFESANLSHSHQKLRKHAK